MCKEKLKVEKDAATLEVAMGSHNDTGNAKGASNPVVLNGILNQNCDENCYFVDAKRIRVSVKNKTTD